jgi:hypothetical protein
MENWTPRTNNTGVSLIETNKFLEEDVDGNAVKIVSSLQDACIRSDNCILNKKFGWCMDLTETTRGTCYEYLENSGTWRESNQSANKCTDIFVGQQQVIGSSTLTTSLSEREACATKGMQAYGGGIGVTVSSTAVVDDFECMGSTVPAYQPTFYCTVGNPVTKQNYTNEFSCIAGGGQWIEQPPAKPIRGAGMTERVCREVALGHPIYKNNQGEVISPAPEYGPSTMNKGFLDLQALSSKEAIAMGHETGIGQPERIYKGVIYAPNIEKNVFMSAKDAKAYTTYGVQENERAVWSRHGGSFDIMVGYPPPENNCRDANSNGAVNLDWHLGFDQICCNVRGPLHYYQCADRCYHNYQGPLITDLEYHFKTAGLSHLFVNVHECARDDDGNCYDIQ